MAIRTQGTDIFALDPDSGEILDIGCVTSISGIDETLEQIETTCLQSRSRTYESGLATPGTATFGINFDPSDPNHIELFAWKKAGKKLQWAVGFRQESAASAGVDGDAPTVDTENGWELPTTRAWITFEGFINSLPFDFSLNAVVASTVGIQVSGEINVVPAVVTP